MKNLETKMNDSKVDAILLLTEGYFTKYLTFGVRETNERKKEVQ